MNIYFVTKRQGIDMSMSKYLGAGLALALGLAPFTGVKAQDADSPVGSYTAMARSGPQCPTIAWQVARLPNSQAVTGIVWFMDLSGVSTARGTISADGKVAVTLTSIQGSGPTGTVSGTRGADGGLDVTLDGPGCSKLHIVRMPATQSIPQGSG